MKKHLTNEEIAKYRDELLLTERGIETALQTICDLEPGDGKGNLRAGLNRALELVQAGLRSDHLLRDWGE